MKAITLWQPWAMFVAVGWKSIETRTHQRFKSLVGQRIAIHAAKKIDEASIFNNFVPDMNAPQVVEYRRMIDECKGQILCTATVADARWAPNVDFVEREHWNITAMCEVAGKFCLFLEDIKPLRSRVPFRGRQGIFDVPDELITEDI